MARSADLVLAIAMLAACSDPKSAPPVTDAGVVTMPAPTAFVTADAGCPASADASPLRAIGAGGAHTCALTTNGNVLCWGANTYGQLGDGTVVDSARPVAVCGLEESVAIAVGTSHTCALGKSGAVSCWGWNFLGQLGSSRAGTYSAFPTPVASLPNGTSAIAAGGEHTCAIATDGAISCWGSNTSGELGNGAMADKSPEPTAVAELAGSAVAVSAGGAHTCALMKDAHRVACWGADNYGQLGDGGDASSTKPVFAAAEHAAITAGTFFTCSVTTTGAAMCWGYNRLGNLGNGSTDNVASPHAVTGLESGVQAVAAGDGHACALMKEGTARCWGFGGNGQLGNGALLDSLVPVVVEGLSDAASIVTGPNHTCVLTSAGRAACFGANSRGQLGDGSTRDRMSPVFVRPPE